MNDLLAQHRQLTEQAAQLAASIGRDDIAAEWRAIHKLTAAGRFGEAQQRKAGLEWEMWVERADIVDLLEHSADSE